MIYLYLALAIVGGGVLGLQLVLGDHDAGAHDVGLDHDLDAAGLFLSLRFWSFGTLAAGLVGVLATLLGLAGPIAIGVVAALTGFVAGAGTTIALRALARAAASTTAAPSLVGQVGRVLVPPAREARGKVRLDVAGSAIDVLAVSDEDGIGAGDAVVVTEMRGALAVVTKTDADVLSEPPRLPR